MTISVALCTYNGARFIRKQIESILNQTNRVDEIVICDDGSTDETLSIVNSLCKGFDVSVRIYQNESNLGVCANFQKAVDLCEGEIIFLSDQDDVWHLDKVDAVVKYFNKHPDKQVVFTDATLIDETDEIVVGKSLWNCIGMTPEAQLQIDNGLGIELFACANRATGATMAVKRTFPFLHQFHRFTDGVILHDYAIALLALGSKQLGYIPACYINYRLHSNQQCGIWECLKTPLDDNLCHTNYETIRVANLGFPNNISSRIVFLIQRDRNRHKANGVFRIIGSLGQYKSICGDVGCNMARDDLRQWMRNQRNRFSIKTIDLP